MQRRSERLLKLRMLSMAQQINVVSTCTLPAFEPLCSNCKIRPIAEATNCFEDWCHECDTSLWVSRQSEYVDGPLCSNCNILPVAAVTNCFEDWCHQCDASLWASRSSADKTDLNSSTSHSSTYSLPPNSLHASQTHPSATVVQNKHPESPLPGIEALCTTVNDVNDSISLSQSVDHNRVNVGCSLHLDEHSFFQYTDFVTLGQPLVKTHRLDAGLTELQFENCVLKVRVGRDLNEIIRCSSTGPVYLSNLSTNGWAANSDTLLPSFIFIKYISSFTLQSESRLSSHSEQ
jgi:hypothetical protein